MVESIRDTATLEGESDLKQFLKVVRPEWSHIKKHGSSNIQRVMEKLRAIGVGNPRELMNRAATNQINEDLANAGYPRFSRDTLESIRHQGAFFRALENLTEANFRQTGDFAPVPRMLSKRIPRGGKAFSSGALARPASQPGPSATDLLSSTSQWGDAEVLTFALPESSFSSGYRRPRTVGALSRSATSVRSDAGSDDECEERPVLRGYRGEVLGTSGARPRTSPVPLPDIPVVLGRHRAFERLLTPSGEGGPAAEPSFTLGSSRPKAGMPTDGAGMTSSPSLGAMTGGLLVTPVRSRLAIDMDSTGSPHLGRSIGPYGLEAELADLQAVASGAGAPGQEEALDRLARFGEEELLSLSQNASFHSQGGTDIQVVRIAALYAKLGLPVSLTAGTLQNPGLTVHEARTELDRTIMRGIMRAGAAMHSGRPSCWACVDRPGGRPAKAQHADPSSALLRRAEAMLAEQEALKEKAKLYRQMDFEGIGSPMRHHVARNIHSRLKEGRDPEMDMMEVGQQCANIRRHLMLMGNAKGDLKSLKRIVEAEEAKRQADEAKRDGYGTSTSR